MDFSNAHVQRREPLVREDMNDDARFVALNKITYNGVDNKTRVWESADRLTRAKDSGVDAVGILAILEKGLGPEIVLQKQFRPPIDKVCIEIPAGLMDGGESAETCAIRELKEETGYVCQVANHNGHSISPVMFNDPGMCSTNLHVVRVTVDMGARENQHPEPQLEEDEFIETFSVPLVELYEQCRQLEKQGFAIDARVGTIAEGIELAKQWKLA